MRELEESEEMVGKDLVFLLREFSDQLWAETKDNWKVELDNPN